MALQNPISPVIWQHDRVMLIDQTCLPNDFEIVEIRDSAAMASAIQTMIVRGAPAIGVAAAYGVVLGAREIQTTDRAEFLAQLQIVADRLAATRPTAVNLFWALDRMLKTAHSTPGDLDHLRAVLLTTAQTICSDDVATCQAIGDHERGPTRGRASHHRDIPMG